MPPAARRAAPVADVDGLDGPPPRLRRWPRPARRARARGAGGHPELERRRPPGHRRSSRPWTQSGRMPRRGRGRRRGRHRSGGSWGFGGVGHAVAGGAGRNAGGYRHRRRAPTSTGHGQGGATATADPTGGASAAQGGVGGGHDVDATRVAEGALAHPVHHVGDAEPLGLSRRGPASRPNRPRSRRACVRGRAALVGRAGRSPMPKRSGTPQHEVGAAGLRRRTRPGTPPPRGAHGRRARRRRPSPTAPLRRSGRCRGR